MSDFNVTDLHDSLLPEAQLSFGINCSAVQHQSTIHGAMPIDEQPPMERPTGFLDHGVQQDSSSDNDMHLSDDEPLPQLPELPDNSGQQDSLPDAAMKMDEQQSFGHPSQPYTYSTQDDIVFNPGDFERDFAHIMENPQGW